MEREGSLEFARIVANLDFEETLHAAGPGAPRRLSAQARISVRLLGTVLRVLASPGDRIWLPEGVSPTRLPEVPGLPPPTLETGPLRALPPARDWLAWGETAEIADLRARDLPPGVPRLMREGEGLTARLWRAPRPLAPIARHVHDRRIHVQLADRLGLALPGRRVLHSTRELEAHLAAGGAESSPTGEWILKPLFSAAGRNWVRGSGPRLDRRARLSAEKGFAPGRPLVFEPRLERFEDFGVALCIEESAVEVIGLHEIECSSSGRFQGIRASADSAGESPRLDRIRAAAARIGAELHALGYRGPCGIDTWVGRNAAGEEQEVLLGEVNARLTFGWLAHLWRDHLVRSGDAGGGSTLALRISAEEPPPRSAVRLIDPGEHDRLSAWLELHPDPPGGPPPGPTLRGPAPVR
jgi:hypothetical protein